MRPIGTADRDALLALNNAHAAELSLLDPERFAELVAGAFLARCSERSDAFILAFDEAAAYDSPNFLWFRARYRRFVYVDRVVVAPASRGLGIGRRFYEAVADLARSSGRLFLGCEVNALPPNPVSDAFHARLGFAPVGAAEFDGGARTVRYLGRVLDP